MAPPVRLWPPRRAGWVQRHGCPWWMGKVGVPAALSPKERGASMCRKETLQLVSEVSVVCGGPPTVTRGNWGMVESTHQESLARVSALPCPGQTGPGSAAPDAILASNQGQRDKWECPLGSRPQWRVQFGHFSQGRHPPSSRAPCGAEEGQEATPPPQGLAEPPWVPVPPHSLPSSLGQRVSFG